MRIVVDTSVIVAVLVSEPERPALLAATKGAELLAPASVPWEVGNALAAMLKRKRLRLAQARSAAAAYEQVPLRLIEVDLGTALELADTLNLYAYDAYVLVTAASQRAPLLTLDRALARAARLAELELVEMAT